jgi:hypothetical protein
VTVRARLLAATGFAAAVGSCAHGAGPAPAPAPMPAVAAADLPLPDSIPGTFAVRQKLVARSNHGGGSFEAVLQKQPGRLTLVGLTPYGSRAFLLEQVGPNVTFTSYIPRELPFPPTFILMDIHHVFDQWLGAPIAAGERSGLSRGVRIHELWRGGRLQSRTFTQPGDSAVPFTSVTYEGPGPLGLAAHIKIVNFRFGYTLDIETLPL